MAVECVVDVRQFADLVPRLAKITGKSLSQVVKQQAKLLVRGSGEGRDEGLVPYTPPFEEKGGQKWGHAIVRRDVSRVFLTLANARKIIKRAGVRGAGVALTRALQNNQNDKVAALLNGQMDKRSRVRGYQRQQGGRQVAVRAYTQNKSQQIDLKNQRLGRIESVSAQPQAAIHKSRQRGDSKLVRGKQWSQLVTESGSLAQYIKRRQRNVGIMKAGWRNAAQALGATLPSYVKNAPRGSGSVVLDLDNESPSVTLTNSTPTISRAIRGILDRALRGRRIRMKADIERKLAAALAKAK